MKSILLALLFSSAALADTVGTVSGTNVVMVPATASALVMQCAAANIDKCWPTNAASMAPSVALGSLPATGRVWAQVGTATRSTWVAASAVTIPVAASGGSAVPLIWIAPTTNTDGSAISATLTYNLYRGTSATTLAKIASGLASPAYTDTVASTGTWFYAATAIAGGIESAQSAVFSVAETVTKVAPTPNAPKGLTVTQITLTVPNP